MVLEHAGVRARHSVARDPQQPSVVVQVYVDQQVAAPWRR